MTTTFDSATTYETTTTDHDRPVTTNGSATARVPAARTAAARPVGTDASNGARLLAVLESAISEVAEADPDLLDSGLPRGRELLDLAATARADVARLGGEAGTTLAHGPGVVVVRELVEATWTLRFAIARTAQR